MRDSGVLRFVPLWSFHEVQALSACSLCQHLFWNSGLRLKLCNILVRSRRTDESRCFLQGTFLQIRRSTTERLSRIDSSPALAWPYLPHARTEFLRPRREHTKLVLSGTLEWGWAAAIQAHNLPKPKTTFQCLLASGRPGREQTPLRPLEGQDKGKMYH